MTRHRKVSRWRWAVFAASAALCAVGILAPRVYPAPRPTAARMSALLAERDRLAVKTDATRDALRQQAGSVASPVWDENRIAELRRKLGSDWQWSEEPGVAGVERRAVVSALALELKRWPTYLAAVEFIERQPGIVVEAIDFAAENAGSARTFVRVVLTLRLLRPRARTPGNKERTATLFARSLFRGQRRRPGGARSHVSSLRPPSACGSRPGSAPAETRDPACTGREQLKPRPTQTIQP